MLLVWTFNTSSAENRHTGFLRKELYNDTFLSLLTDHSGHYAYILFTKLLRNFTLQLVSPLLSFMKRSPCGNPYFISYSINCPHFPSTYPYPEPHQFLSQSKPIFLIIRIWSSNMCTFSNYSLSITFPHQTLYAPLLYPKFVTRPSVKSLLILYTKLHVFCKECRPICSSLCSLPTPLSALRIRKPTAYFPL